MRYSFALPLAASMLTGCVAPRPAPVAPPRITAPPPRPAPIAAPISLAADWNDWPFTPGDWTYRQVAGTSVAQFVPLAEATPVTLRCDRVRREIVLTLRSGAAMTVRTTTLTRTLPMRGGDGDGGVFARMAAADPLLDAIAFSRGRFVIERAERAPLVLPPYAEIGRVIEDCRG